MTNKIHPLNELVRIIAEFRASVNNSVNNKGKKLVFTNGCFDIIHAGHVQYLQEARALGDMLIVAVNSDDSVRRLKPRRPIVTQAERALVLSALAAVDYVLIFDEDTPIEVISALRPDILVKGGDWRKEDIVGSSIVPDVYSLPYVAGMSTTGIINKILEAYS
ncbi:D-glycero-beta-D-manno-heptose 1-phosphate adenylyltransferase [Candidatus Magnetominusculus xianensis]|uniref:D-glycero-beta-D-manno-heptose 1-phosphate adenylyltransferase n=1 Tax=Candidatus Magnetominusculus xianensis TaxID=1748249 RepID=A0ABR5SHG3_9BACT|nr:D-glycero-beta-D-manno-heptose 1-phosphate adenylyltransferase [Candidatus Magnetominusculus xianensis]KWT91116.1 bifunctional protein HldE [Candidatus Magnetominusculus xianensis]MBF0403239.1 D-glycero-beta-D-manno-heptose 1-phosphate adenylyltransferase [Nitrospirota bacterium]